MSPPPRSLRFAVSTSLLTATVPLIGCAEIQPAVNPVRFDDTPEQGSTTQSEKSPDEPEPIHVNEGPEPDPQAEPEPAPLKVNPGPEGNQDTPAPPEGNEPKPKPVKVNPGPEGGVEPKRVNIRPN